MMEEDRMMPLKEAAYRLGVSIKTLRRMMDRGVLPKSVQQGGRMFYPNSIIQNYIAKLKQTCLKEAQA